MTVEVVIDTTYELAHSCDEVREQLNWSCWMRLLVTYVTRDCNAKVKIKMLVGQIKITLHLALLEW